MRASPFTILTEDELPERLRGLDPYGRVEAALVGRILMDEGAMLKAIRLGVDDTYFEHEVFRRAWVAARSCQAKGIPCDMHSIRAELRTMDPEDDTLFSEIALLFESPGYNAHVKHFARILRYRAGRRLAESACKLPGEAESIEDYAAEVIHTGNEMVKIAGAIVDDGSEDQRSQWQVMDDDLEAAVQGKQGVMTGLRDLDAILGGIRHGEYVVVGARPAVGKSSLAITACVNLLKQNPEARIFYASPEMTTPEVLKRLVSARAKVSTRRYETQGLLAGERDKWMDARQEFERAKIRVSHKGMHDPKHVRAEAIRLSGEWGGLDLIVVDHLHVMRGEGKSLNEKMTAISQSMLYLCHEVDAPMLALAQLSRDLERRDDKSPQLHDLRDSGSLEQDANTVIMLHRDTSLRPEDFRHEMDIHVRKLRRGDPCSVKGIFVADCTLIEDYWPKNAEVWNG